MLTSPAVVEVLTAESAVLVKLYTVTVIEDLVRNVRSGLQIIAEYNMLYYKNAFS